MRASPDHFYRLGREIARAPSVMRPLAYAFAIVLALCVSLSRAETARAASPPTKLRVLLPDGDNLQYLSFWVARGAGYFADEGFAIETAIPPAPAAAMAWMTRGEADVAVLPPPVYLQLIANRFPLLIVCNLLANDPIDLVVRRSIFDERKMNAHAPMADRLRALAGLRVGVAPGPPTRLRALFASQGLDADRLVTVVIRHGNEQNDAFAKGEVDALYAHTPYLETALDDQGATMLVNQSGGEVPELATRQIHALVVGRAWAEARHDAVVALVRAIARAERLVHENRDATVQAVMRALPSLDERHVRTIVGIYEPAVPATPRVSIEGLAPALALFPASRTPPSLDGIPLGEFVAPSYVEEATAALDAERASSGNGAASKPAAASIGGRVAIAGAGLAVILAAIAMRRRRG
jgi:NitT/TauT family transport system substrate-binding protein